MNGEKVDSQKPVSFGFTCKAFRLVGIVVFCTGLFKVVMSIQEPTFDSILMGVGLAAIGALMFYVARGIGERKPASRYIGMALSLCLFPLAFPIGSLIGLFIFLSLIFDWNPRKNRIQEHFPDEQD